MNLLAALFANIFERRVRGFRIVEVVVISCFVLMVFWVYLAKAAASDERARIAQLEQQINDEQRRVKLLGAEAAHLETPQRIETLSQNYLGLQPVKAAHEAGAERLSVIARDPHPEKVAEPAKTEAAAVDGAHER